VVLSEAVAQPSPDKAQEAMAVGAVRAEAMLYKRLGLLAASANVATMLGLLGTVYGLIVAFSALGDGAAGQAANSLSEGISMAMSTTAWGLMVAIPTTAAHALLEARAEQLLASVEVMAGELILSKRD
jgi:biopolymer transport protein ExbB